MKKRKKGQPTRIIVAGSRTFNDFELLKKKMDHFTKNMDLKKVIIVSGHAKGADQLGEKWASLRWVTQEIYRPNYQRYKPYLAPLMRNEEMARVAQHLILFWDGVSSGSKDMLETAKEHGLNIRVVLYKELKDD